MDITDYEMARRIAEQFIPDDCGLLEDAIEELAEGWYFIHQTVEDLASGDDLEMMIGHGGFLVERQGGRVVEFGSRYSLEQNLEAYRAGLIPGPVDLTLVVVHDRDAAVAALVAMGLTYVTPEYESGETWKVARQYTPKQMSYRVRPEATFRQLQLGFADLDALGKLKQACEISLAPSKPTSWEQLRCTKCKSAIVNPDLTADEKGAIAELRKRDTALATPSADRAQVARSTGGGHQTLRAQWPDRGQAASLRGLE